MIIRSQDRESIIPIPNKFRVAIYKIDDKWDISANLYRIGVYSTRQRAIEVLDEIQNAYANGDKVYEMSEE